MILYEQVLWKYYIVKHDAVHAFRQYYYHKRLLNLLFKSIFIYECNWLFHYWYIAQPSIDMTSCMS